ncbi:MAG: phosphonate C-P lyase system protein PhnG [Thermodesulfobacteriota bacterium]|nr:phosphonate C-P lyase system protein PhnG [Thermodesulfobacteriota bacterium]
MRQEHESETSSADTEDGADLRDGREQRRHWLSVLAHALPRELERAFQQLPDPPEYTFLRRPETGLVLVEARTGGTGGLFYPGEATVTRCTIQLKDGTLGVGYVLGSDAQRAERVAVFDALLQNERLRGRLMTAVVEPLERRQKERRRLRRARAASTRVEFLTLRRGE